MLLILVACIGYSFVFGVAILGVLAALLLIVFLLSISKAEKPRGPFCVSAEDEGNDPAPEPAEKLPYVYYDKPVKQVAHTIRYYSPYLGIDEEIRFRPRKNRGKSFDNVRGIVVADNLVLLRSILFTSNLPGDIREIAKQYEGRFPNEAEIRQIYAKFDEINQNLYECGEPLLKRWEYLYTSGDEDADKAMNYCLNFETGQKSLADCDSDVCAVLVERLKECLPQDKLEDEFDVLCEVGGKQVRLPFSKRDLGNPVGIFPSKHSPLYLELDEVENKKHTDKDVDESRLLDEKYFCAGAAAVKDRMNIYLEKLGAPILEGIYLADSTYMQGCGWLVGFEKGNKCISSDYYGGNQPAKLRYMGCFEGKCQK